MEKQTVTVTIYDSEAKGAKYPPTAFAEHLAWLQTFLAATPEDCKDSLRVELNTYSDYGYNATYYRVVYDRLETDEELAVREAQAQLWSAQQVAQQHAQEVYQKACTERAALQAAQCTAVAKAQL